MTMPSTESQYCTRDEFWKGKFNSDSARQDVINRAEHRHGEEAVKLQLRLRRCRTR